MWKIAIVDDDRQVLKGLKSQIPWQELNAECVGVGMDGSQGLEIVHANNPDIIITDIYMPEMNGLEMIQTLRQEEYKGKIIIHSGYNDFDYARQAIRLHVDDYLSKPISLQTLRNVLSKAIQELDEDSRKKREQSEMQKKLTLFEPFLSKEWLKGALTGTLGCSYQDSYENTKHNQAVEFIIQFIHKHYDEEITLTELAEKVFISRNYLCDIFKKATGETFLSYLTRVRMEKAKQLIMEGKLHVYEIAERVGYKNVPYFSTVFKKYFSGISPTKMIK
jgi:two-component system response regulator YesN